MFAALGYALGTLALTTIHHFYGAYIYDTPWRAHVALVSIPAALVLLVAAAVSRIKSPWWIERIAHAVFVLTVLAVPIAMFGVFEGLYNHVLKNILFFVGVPAWLLAGFFPSPRYEMPNDLFFELTGVLQAVPAGLAAWQLWRSIDPRTRRTVKPGDIVMPRQLPTIRGTAVRIPHGERYVHLQFRRFAGCPVCDLHLRSFTRRGNEIADTGIEEVVVFHSTRADLLRYEAALPFAVVADRARRLYAEFGVEAAPKALLDPRAWPAIALGVIVSAWRVVRRLQPLPSLAPDGGSLGLPADLLIDPSGRVVASKYGVHANDQWSVDELLSFVAAAARGTAPRGVNRNGVDAA